MRLSCMVLAERFLQANTCTPKELSNSCNSHMLQHDPESRSGCRQAMNTATTCPSSCFKCHTITIVSLRAFDLGTKLRKPLQVRSDANHPGGTARFGAYPRACIDRLSGRNHRKKERHPCCGFQMRWSGRPSAQRVLIQGVVFVSPQHWWFSPMVG